MTDPALADLTEVLAEHHFDGVVLIRRGAATLFEAESGLASRRWRVPNTFDTRFDTASITKLFTAAAVMRLAGRDELDLEIPIRHWIDADLDGTAIDPRVTLLHVLTHTSGIADDADEEAGEDYEALFHDVPNYRVLTPSDQLPFFVHKAPLAEPGTICRYCNAGYVLAGLVLEAVTGRSFRDVIFDEVFEPAGMLDSGWYDRRDDAPRVAEGWDLRDGSWVQNIYAYPPIGEPAGGAHVTAGDLLKFISAVREGRLLTPDLTEDFMTPQVEHPDGEWYGFGLIFDVRDDGSVRSYYKDGENPGVSGIVRHYVDEDVDVVVLSNTQEGAWPIIEDIDSRFAD
jgi:CubicO group peptidase (beta-lactamase class C family)